MNKEKEKWKIQEGEDKEDAITADQGVVHKTELWLRLNRESQWAADANTSKGG